jgi:hypothetical protein
VIRGAVLGVIVSVAIVGGVVAWLVTSGKTDHAFDFPSFTSPAGQSVSGSFSSEGSEEHQGGTSASFIVGSGGSIRVTQSGTTQVSGYGAHLDHDGPLGCAGRYFVADYSDDIRILFHYTRKDAWMQIGTDAPYHFPGPPKQGDGTLTWHRTFGDRPITATVDCPLPKKQAS